MGIFSIHSNYHGPLYLQVLHAWIQPTRDQKYSGEKIPDSSKKQNLNWPHAGHCAESTLMKSCVVTPCCGLYTHTGYTQTLHHFTEGTGALMDFCVCGGTNPLYPLLIRRDNCHFHVFFFKFSLFDVFPNCSKLSITTNTAFIQNDQSLYNTFKPVEIF